MYMGRAGEQGVLSTPGNLLYKMGLQSSWCLKSGGFCRLQHSNQKQTLGSARPSVLYQTELKEGSEVWRGFSFPQGSHQFFTEDCSKWMGNLESSSGLGGPIIPVLLLLLSLGCVQLCAIHRWQPTRAPSPDWHTGGNTSSLHMKGKVKTWKVKLSSCVRLP